MNTSSDFNSTPKTMNRNNYFETLLDFSTPMSTMSNRWKDNLTTKHYNTRDEKNSTITNETMLDVNNNNNHETILDKLVQKFSEHKNHFHHTQNYLNSLDGHLHEITHVLYQLQTSLDHNPLLKSTTDQFETRLVQMATKREQIRTAINNLHQSPTINQTLNDIIQQISSSPSKMTLSTDPVIYYTDLINVVKLSLNQKTNLIERFHHDEDHRKHRINMNHSKLQQRHQLLMELVEKLLEQQKLNEKSVETIHLNRPQFDNHTEQLTEFNKLTEEYQILQDENRLLKHQAKENIKILYTFINQATE